MSVTGVTRLCARTHQLLPDGKPGETRGNPVTFSDSMLAMPFG